MGATSDGKLSQNCATNDDAESCSMNLQSHNVRLTTQFLLNVDFVEKELELLMGQTKALLLTVHLFRNLYEIH